MDERHMVVNGHEHAYGKIMCVETNRTHSEREKEKERRKDRKKHKTYLQMSFTYFSDEYLLANEKKKKKSKRQLDQHNSMTKIIKSNCIKL